MFLGEFTHKLDSKNRIMMPSEFREELIDGIFITKGPESSLIIYTKDEFDNNEESNIDLGVFTKINYSNYNTNTNSINTTNNNNTYDNNITVSPAIDTNVNKIIIKPKGSN